MPEKRKTLLDCCLDTGMPGHLAMLVFVLALVFAWIIFRQRRGFRYRMAFVPLSIMPLMSGIMGCCYEYAMLRETMRSAELKTPKEPAIEYSGTIIEWPLQVLAMGSVQTSILIMIAAVLLMQRDGMKIADQRPQAALPDT